MYEFTSRVRYSEVDSDGKLTFMSVLNYFQDCSTFQSEDMNVGIAYYKKIRQAWVINYWQIDILKMPMLGEKIVIGTLPYALKGFLGYRNFYMKDAQTGEMLAVANSIWTLIDIDTVKPVRANEDIIGAYEISDKIDMEYLDRKTISSCGDLTVMSPIEVSSGHLDTNKHVNNGQYVNMALSYVDEGFKIKRLQAEYVNQALLGDIIVPKVNKTEDYVFVSLDSEDGKTFAKVKIS